MAKSLREIHKESPYTKEQVADYMNVSTRTIYLWETGKSPISAASLYKLLSFYKVDMPISSIRTLIPNITKDTTINETTSEETTIHEQ